jgi:hypothetical protein
LLMCSLCFNCCVYCLVFKFPFLPLLRVPEMRAVRCKGLLQKRVIITHHDKTHRIKTKSPCVLDSITSCIPSVSLSRSLLSRIIIFNCSNGGSKHAEYKIRTGRNITEHLQKSIISNHKVRKSCPTCTPVCTPCLVLAHSPTMPRLSLHLCTPSFSYSL